MEHAFSLRGHRVTRRPDFQVCYDAGCRLFSPNFILFVHRRDSGPESWRAGFAVSKKIGKAVARNRIRRILREFFRLYGQGIPARTDIIAVPKRHTDAAGLSLAKVRAELEPLLRKHIRHSRRQEAIA